MPSLYGPRPSRSFGDGSIPFLEFSHGREGSLLVDGGVEGEARVDDETGTVMLELNAGAADLMGPTVNGRLHRSKTGGLPDRTLFHR